MHICFSFFLIVIIKRTVPLSRFDSEFWIQFGQKHAGYTDSLPSDWFSTKALCFSPYSYFKFYHTVGKSFSGKGGKLSLYAKEML